MAKRRVIVRRKKYVPPVLPERPKVTVGPRCYGRTKKGRYICIRFFVTQWKPGHAFKDLPPDTPWFVVDLENEEFTYYAQGTSAKGYPKKEDAVRIARQLRDEYGAWAVVPF